MTFSEPGLSQDEARRRLAADGPNALPGSRGRGAFALLGSVSREPMFLLLIGAASLYVVLGDVREALVLAASIVVVLGITVVQERRTERALEALRDLSSPRALVVRDGREQPVAGSAVVRGDLLVLREGDRVAADARLHEAHDLQLDESLLTGESVPVSRFAGTGDAAEARVLSGTLVVKGTGRGEVFATGPRTEVGRIGASLESADSGKTSLERETSRMVRLFAAGGLALCVAVALLYFLARGDPVAAILAGLTLAMAMLPEEFPVVLTVFLALGAWRIAKHGVLTRRLPAVEMLGATTVLCCDKTGTLTENRMTLVETWIQGRWQEPGGGGEAEVALLEDAALACEASPFDPMDRAILSAAPGAQALRRAGTLERRHPLGSGFLAVCHGWRLASGEMRASMKGAPETVLPLCDLSASDRAAALDAAAGAAARGLRVLGVARAMPAPGQWAEAPSGYAFRFLGFIALADPMRAAVPAAVALLQRAGVRVVMITGDHAATARAIASQAGIAAGQVVTGPQIEAMGEHALEAAVRSAHVFARVRPEQKLRLVNALRAAGEVVAMTGDGVNDAPALKAAHIGVAMGKRGTDVAREAAALVLLEDDFTAIVGTVRLGRRIYDNIRNAMRYLVAVHVPMAGMSVIPLLMGWPLFAFPVHVVFLEFVIDPACSIVFEAERSHAGIMERPPRGAGERLFTPASLALGVLQGLAVLVAVAGVYWMHIDSGAGETHARAVAFVTLVAGNLGLILVNRSHRLTILELGVGGNAALWWVLGGAAAALGLLLYVPAAAEVFRFAAPGAKDVFVAALAGIGSVLWYDAFKLLRRAYNAGGKARVTRE